MGGHYAVVDLLLRKGADKVGLSTDIRRCTVDYIFFIPCLHNSFRDGKMK